MTASKIYEDLMSSAQKKMGRKTGKVKILCLDTCKMKCLDFSLQGFQLRNCHGAILGKPDKHRILRPFKQKHFFVVVKYNFLFHLQLLLFLRWVIVLLIFIWFTF